MPGRSRERQKMNDKNGKYERDKRRYMPPCLPPIRFCKIDTEQRDVSCHRIGEDVPVPDVGKRVKKPTGQRQENRDRCVAFPASTFIMIWTRYNRCQYMT
jgi:hypothetical protein